MRGQQSNSYRSQLLSLQLLSVSVCSCVQRSRVLFVLPMYEELQQGQMNSYTSFDWLNGGVFFTSTKDKTPPLRQANVVYEFICPGCTSSNIGKTNRTLLVRTQEHALTDKESVLYKHLRYCDHIKHIQGLYNLPDIFINDNNPPSTAMSKEFLTQTVRGNTTIINSDDIWNLLLYQGFW